MTIETTHLKYYAMEEEKVKAVAPECFRIRLDEKQVDLVARKLSRHFKFRMPEVIIWGEDRGFGASACGGATFIRVPRNVELYTVIHELGHCYEIRSHFGEYLKGSYRKLHTKKLTRIVLRFAKYCRKKDYWKLGRDEPILMPSTTPDGARLPALSASNEPALVSSAP